MRLSEQEMSLFDSACANRGNLHAQELLNVFGAERAREVLEKVPTIPLGIVIDVVGHIWLALTFEACRRGQDQYPWLFEAESSE